MSAFKSDTAASDLAIVAARELLKKHWGFDTFKPDQETALRILLAGFDLLGIMPTGFGKSAIFQIAAMMLEGTAIIISPLIALMKDQADDCKKRGLSASYLSSTLDDEIVLDRMKDFAKGRFKMFYIAPERINSKSFKEALARVKVSLIVVDEAHCVSRLGHDFRPEYQRIQDLVEQCLEGDVRPPICAVTATATGYIEKDIAQGCGMRSDYKRIVGDPIRANLEYITWAGNPWRQIEVAARSFRLKEGRYVVYAGSRKGAEKVAEIIQDTLGDAVANQIGFYHAGMDKDDRTKVQDDFKAGKLRCVVATCAFGMGIDVPDIRGVVHFGIPGCVEDYVQESGRAGRDGLPSRVILICNGERDYSVTMRRMFLDAENPLYEVYEELWAWLHATLEPGQILSLSGEEIAGRMLTEKRDARHGGLKAGLVVGPVDEQVAGVIGGRVLGCLSTMAAYGLVSRGTAQAGVTVEVNPAELELYPREKASVLMTRVLAWLDEEVAAWKVSDESWTEHVGRYICVINVDLEEVANRLDLGESALNALLTKLAAADVLRKGKKFKGKTTQIIKYGAKLADILPRAKIEEKRRRAEQRLDSMLRYLFATDKRAYIRQYFLGSDT